MRNFLRTLSLLMALLIAGRAHASLKFTHLDGKDGLLQSYVLSLHEDRRGLMWIGTRNGLCVYNGFSMMTYHHDWRNPYTLPNNVIHVIFQDRMGNVWVGTDRGCCVYDCGSNRFLRIAGLDNPVYSFAEVPGGRVYCSGGGHLYLLDIKALKVRPVTAGGKPVRATTLATGSRGVLWIGCQLGLYSYNKGRLAAHPEVHVDTRLPQNNEVISLYQDPAGPLWVGLNGGGVVRYDPVTRRVDAHTAGLAGGIVRCIGKDQDRNVWVGTDTGLSILTPDGRIRNEYQAFNDAYSLSDNSIYSIVRDRNGNMWVGTYFGGVNIFHSDNHLSFYTPARSGGSMPGKVVRQMAEDDSGKIWIAYEQGGMAVFDPSTETFREFGAGMLPSWNIHSVQIDGKGQVWAGCFMGGLERFSAGGAVHENYNTSNSPLRENSIFALHKDSRGTIWVGSAKGLYYVDGNDRLQVVRQDFLSKAFIFNISDDGKGRLWIGTRNKGLVCYDPRKGSIRQWRSKPEEGSLGDDFITATLIDRRGSVWVGTNNSGLYRMNADGSFHSFMDRRTFRDVCIYALAEGRDGSVWVTTSSGIYKYDAGDGTFTQFQVDEGIPFMHFNFSSLLASRTGKIYAGSVNGLLVFDPNGYARSRKPLDIFLTGLRLYNDSTVYIDRSDKVSLSYSESRKLAIGFAAIDIDHLGNIAYQVRMHGVDKDWQNVVSLHEIVYSHLSPGTYTFMVRATSEPGKWDRCVIRSLKIRIRPPFYLSWPAMLLYVILAAALALYVRNLYRIRALWKRKAYERGVEREKERHLTEMKQQFMTEVTHEFKTPLSLIIAPVRQILDGSHSMDKVTEDGLRLILKGANTLKSLLEKLILVSNLKDGDSDLTFTDMNPMDMIDDLGRRFMPLFKNKEIIFEMEVENWGEKVVFSPLVVESVVNNLLSNAYKFTGPGGLVELSAAIVDEKGKRMLKITVTDSGTGIAPENQERIFEKFYQVRDSNIAVPGWGVGLSLVKKLVTSHKGRIELQSKLGEGSCFTVYLDVTGGNFAVSTAGDKGMGRDDLILLSGGTVTRGDGSALDGEAGDREAEQADRAKVLIVEDNEDLLAYLATLFNSYSVMKARNGEEAYALVRGNNLPDIIIADVMMPKMSGTELCAKVKSDPLTAHIPIILLTARTGTKNALDGYQHGADVYMEKPFNPSMLQLQVKNLLATRDMNRQKFREAEDFDLMSIAGNKYDEELLQKIQQFVDSNLDNSELRVDDIVNAVGVSKTKLHVKMKSLLNVSIGEYIKEMRIKKAKELFRQGYSTADVAFATGFSDVNYFSKCFKKNVGSTPKEFIASLHGGNGTKPEKK